MPTQSKIPMRLPGVLSIECTHQAGPSGSGGHANYGERPMYRLWGIYGVYNDEGMVEKVVEVDGNWAPFHTCCGGIRLSALRTAVRPRPDSRWGQLDSPFCNEGRNTYVNVLSWARLNAETPSYVLPNFSTITGLEWSQLRTISTADWYDIGRLILALGVKDIMRASSRSLAVAMDGDGGTTTYTLAMLNYLDGVSNKRMYMVKQLPQPDNRLDYRAHLSNEYSRFTAMDIRPYSQRATRNCNSGNLIRNITVMKKCAGKPMYAGANTGTRVATQYDFKAAGPTWAGEVHKLLPVERDAIYVRGTTRMAETDFTRLMPKIPAIA